MKVDMETKVKKTQEINHELVGKILDHRKYLILLHIIF